MQAVHEAFHHSEAKTGAFLASGCKERFHRLFHILYSAPLILHLNDQPPSFKQADRKGNFADGVAVISLSSSTVGSS